MDVDLLISLVQERPSLWDPSSKCYHNRDIGRKKWNEIAEIMNLESVVVKAKWGNVRDMFRKEHTKQMKQPTGSGAKKVCTWKYYEQLSFLRDVFKPRKMTGNIDEPFQQSFEDSSVVAQDEVEEQPSPLPDDIGNDTLPDAATDTDSGTSSSSSNTFKVPAAKKVKHSKTNAMAQFLALEARKVAHLEQIKAKASTSSNEIQDEDYHFMMSILPHFREVPAHRKLAIRIQIQQLLLEERNGQHQPWAPTLLPHLILPKMDQTTCGHT